MKHICLILSITATYLLIGSQGTLEKRVPDEQIANKQTLWEYQRLADAFRNLDFLVEYDGVYRCYKVILYPNDNPIIYWFNDYKNFIYGAYTQAYNNMRNKKYVRTISDASSDLIYSHIRWLETWPEDSLYTTEDVLHKQKVWKAFKAENMNTLSMLLENKNVSRKLINLPV